MSTTTSDSPIGQALEQKPLTPKAMVARYAEDFYEVLPSHIERKSWLRIAQGALKTGERLPSGQTVLERAAHNDPGVFMRELLRCARLGLEPGTEQFYLTPRKVKGQEIILGIVGYQGLIELMYRAGAVASVVAEVVRTNDKFEFSPGVDEIPRHTIDWDSPDRGTLRLVYAFARMKDGATSKVVVLNQAHIEDIKKSAQNPNGQYSPWRNAEESMWLKSAVRQLAKWVPTSSEYIREKLRIAQEVGLPGGTIAEVPADLESGEDLGGPALDDSDVIDVESFEDEGYAYDGPPPDDFEDH